MGISIDFNVRKYSEPIVLASLKGAIGRVFWQGRIPQVWFAESNTTANGVSRY